jgi:uroporphyrinogen decarboxylase
VNKRERFMAAIQGGPIDRPPCTAWIHFGTDRLGGREHAFRHARFVRDNDWDICKVVNDFRYPAPEGMETLTAAADMRRFGRAPMSSEAFVEELKCIRLLRAEFGPDMPIMITGMDPFQQVLRRVGYGRASLIFANREAALAMLDAVCASMCEYMGLVRDAGCDAVFFSINSAICPPNSRGVSDEVARTFLRPFEIRMLEAMAGMVRVLHIHGTSLDVRRVLDYPMEAVSVSDRLPGNPSLREMRAMTDKCLMGGVNEGAIAERSLPEVREEVFDCTRQIGREKFILSPGCTIPTQTPWYLLKAIRETCEKL